MKKVFWLFWVLILFAGVSQVFADNWVCYTYDPTVTEGELRAFFSSLGGDWQAGSPLRIINSGSTVPIFTRTSFIRDCGTSISFLSCPENEYYLKSTFSCTQFCNGFSGAHHVTPHYYKNGKRAADCGLGGAPSCSSWSASSCSTPTKSYTCGTSNNLWFTMSAPQWSCPTCRELAVRQTSEPILDLSSFDRLSFKNYPLYTNTTSDMSFVAYIEACINRVPMMNLFTSLNDAGVSKSHESAIYAKHETLDYNNENMGIVEDFVIPEQSEFMKIYSLNGTLSAYRAWAWRTRLVDGIDRVVTSKSLSIPGFPIDRNPVKIGDLYYSADFLAGANIADIGIDCGGTTLQKQSVSVHVPGDIPQYTTSYMCTVDDLKDYYSVYGMSSQIESTLKSLFGILPAEDILSAEISNAPNEIFNMNYNNVVVNVGDFKFDNSSEFVDYYSIIYNQDKLFDSLIKKKIITYSSLNSKAGAILAENYYYGGSMDECSIYVPKFINYALEGNVVFNVVDNDTVSLNLPIEFVWINDMIANLDLDVVKEFDCSLAWDFANLGDLDSQVLAKCLYNWDSCILSTVNEGSKKYKEVADCGMGPPSLLRDTTLKDAARGKKSLVQNVVVYKSCVVGNNWISSEGTYSCVNGQTYRCKFNPSLDALFVKRVNVDETLKINDFYGYVCNGDGQFKVVSCLE